MFGGSPPDAGPAAVASTPARADVLRPTPPGFTAFPPRPGPVPPSLRRRALLAAGTAYQWVEVLLDRLVSSPLNPLYHTGTIAVFSLAVATVTGIYLFVFYRVGTEEAHRSIEGIMAHPLGVGALMRSLHRYASDAAIVAAVLHGAKMLLGDRFSGARWIGWVSGLVLVGLVWVTGATGYWLVWDVQAQILSVTTARLLDVLPIFGEPLVRTFVDATRVQRFLFFLVLFLHISIPFLLGAVYWLHVMRLSRARFFPPRVVLWVTGAALVAASLVRPALSGPPADLSRLPGAVPVDWFYFPYFPLTALDPRLGWALVFGVGLVSVTLPWWLRAPAPARARVDDPACTGCQRCWRDCPYEAVMMVPREDGGGRARQVAVVNPAKCVGCGICVGACDSAGILLGDQPVSVLGEVVVARLRAVRTRDAERPAVLVYACRAFPGLEPSLDALGVPRGRPGVTVMGLPCAGALHPAMVTKALEAGAAGVFVAACVPEDCPFREGSRWLVERFGGRRAPVLRRPDDGRLRVRWYAPVETARLGRDLATFQETLAARPGSAPAVGGRAGAAPAIEARRPGPARLAGFAALLAVAAGALAVLSAAPWQATPSDAAALRIAFKHVARLEAGPAGGPAPAELAKLPRHMRPQGPAAVPRGSRVDTTLRVTVDERLVLERRYRPGGLRRDGPTFGYEELRLAPGRRRIEVLLVDGDPAAHVPAGETGDAGPWRLVREVDVAPGRVLLVELVEGRGLEAR